MREQDIASAIDHSLAGVTLTPAHRRRVRDGIRQQKAHDNHVRRVKWSAAVTVAAAVFVLFVIQPLNRAPKDDVTHVTSQGTQGNVPVSTELAYEGMPPAPTPLIKEEAPSAAVLLSEEEAVEIARVLLVDEADVTAGDLDQLRQETVFDLGDERALWTIHLYKSDAEKTRAYTVEVDAVTGEAELTYRMREVILAVDDQTEQEYLMDVLRDYEQAVTAAKGNKRFWSFEERAEWARFAKQAGIQQGQWDTVPVPSDGTQEEAVRLARDELVKAYGFDREAVNAMHAYPYMIEDEENRRRSWYIEFCEQVDSEKGYYVRFDVK